jgi:hypothetical protein
MKKYLQYILALTIAATQLASCTKDTESAERNLAQTMLGDKTWYMDFKQTGTSLKTYVGQSTYFIIFLNNGSTNDSDGIVGSYTVEKVAGQLQIHVQAKTSSGSVTEYVYDIESVGAKNLILSFQLSGVKTTYYYSTK